MLRVAVAAIEPGSIAHLALAAEGVHHEERVVEGEHGYGELVAELWEAGGGFVIVEHDVAPWAGAVRELVRCGNDWCAFRYPKAGRMTRGLGLAKFAARLTRDHRDVADAWRTTSWRELDGAVGGAAARALRAENPLRPFPCYHWPPPAHARRPD